MSLKDKPEKKKSWLGMILVIVIIFLIFLPLATTIFYSIPDNQIALVYRLGKFKSEKNSGIHMKLPFGVDRAVIINTGRIYKMDFPINSENGVYVINAEGGASFAEFSIEYSIINPLSWYNYTAQPDLLLYSTAKQISLDILRENANADPYSFMSALTVRLENVPAIHNIGIDIINISVERLNSSPGFKKNNLDDEYLNMVNNSLTAVIRELKDIYTEEFSEKTLNERALKRIDEDGFPWQ